jgi:hypothetical protein
MAPAQRIPLSAATPSSSSATSVTLSLRLRAGADACSLPSCGAD